MTEQAAELAVTAEAGQVALALGHLVSGVVMTWCDERQGWRLGVTLDAVERTFWATGDGWCYEWLGCSWWRPRLWPVFGAEHLAHELVLVLAGLVSWPASTRGQNEDGGQGSDAGVEGALVVSQ